MKKTQESLVIEQLKENGFVTRNWALQNYISRLGAIICDLNHEGYSIQGDWVKTDHGRDFRYTLLDSPKKTIQRIDVDSLPPIKINGRWMPQMVTHKETVFA